jgi:hypothetical protein
MTVPRSSKLKFVVAGSPQSIRAITYAPRSSSDAPADVSGADQHAARGAQIIEDDQCERSPTSVPLETTSSARRFSMKAISTSTPYSTAYAPIALMRAWWP